MSNKLTTVNTEGITDGTIKDEDVKTDAAIAGTKISPDFGSQNVVTTGTIAAGSVSGNLSFGDNNITNVGEISLDKIQPDGTTITLNMGTDKNISFSPSISEIGNVTGFQAINNAGSANTAFGIRATDIRFATGSNERLRITDDGIIGINTDDPNLGGGGDGIHIVSSGVPELHLTKTSQGNTSTDGLQIQMNGTSANIINRESGTTKFYVGGAASGDLKLSITDDKVMFDADAKVGTDDEYDLGASGAKWKDLYLSGDVIVASGHGIDFSARGHAAGMTSELFDNYEEGTWTPVVAGTTSNPTNGGTGWTSQIGRYTIVGRLVYISFYLYHASKDLSGGDGVVSITGLPVNVAGSTTTGFPRINIGYSDNAGNYHSDGSGASHLGGAGWLVNNANTDTLLQYTSTRTEWGSGAASWELSGNGILEMA